MPPEEISRITGCKLSVLRRPAPLSPPLPSCPQAASQVSLMFVPPALAVISRPLNFLRGRRTRREYRGRIIKNDNVATRWQKLVLDALDDARRALAINSTPTVIHSPTTPTYASIRHTVHKGIELFPFPLVPRPFPRRSLATRVPPPAEKSVASSFFPARGLPRAVRNATGIGLTLERTRERGKKGRPKKTR